ncbi:MAG: hypothetical protein ACYDD9_14245 [Acidithiobacillus sp.]
MKDLTKLALVIMVSALAGCSSHHHEASKTLTSKQINENATKDALSGGPLTSKAPPLSAYSLSGYGNPPKQ